MLDYFERLPNALKLLGAVSGYLLSCFSGRLPEQFQDAGLYFGLIVGTVFVAGLVLHLLKTQRGSKQVGPSDLIMLGLGAMVLAAATTLAGFVWLHHWTGASPRGANSSTQNSNAVIESGRRLSEAQKSTLTDALKRIEWNSTSVWIRHAIGCTECADYAADLAEAFRWAGWNDSFGTSLDERTELSGLKLTVGDINDKPRVAQLIAAALEKASVKFDWWVMPGVEKDRIILWVYRQNRRAGMPEQK